MTNEELNLLEKRFIDEKLRIERIKELLNNNLIKEYLEITNTKVSEIPSDSFKDILNRILKDFIITESNEIYVCTGSFYDNGHDEDSLNACYNIDSESVEIRKYRDIETDKEFEAIYKEKMASNLPLISVFEKDKIILNPYNRTYNRNGYDEVRLEFFKNSLEYGQNISKKLILKKYPRL